MSKLFHSLFYKVATISLNQLVTAHSAHAIDLEFASGVFSFLVGPKGNGGSYILRAIAGLEKITSGEIKIGDRRIDDLAPKDRDVAMVFADDSLYPRMTVRENLAFGMKRRRFAATEIRKRIDDVATAMLIADLLERQSQNLSFVEKQRVAIARAIVRQPRVLLFDHPFSRVDNESRVKLRNELASLHERSRATFLFATDDVDEALCLGEMVAILEGGAIRAFGPPRSLYEQPENIFVAEFFGRPPMNLIRGELKQDRGTARFHESGSGTIQFALPNDVNFDLEHGAQIAVGIRPQDIEVAALAAADDGPRFLKFRAIAESVLPGGDGTEIRFDTGTHMGLCRSSSWIDRVEAGRRMEFIVPLKNLHFFDSNSGRKLNASVAG
jgi:multiple sugar transport system ATP-binding protein